MKELFSLGHSYSKIDMSNIIDQNDSLHLSREDKNKIPHYFLREDKKIMYMAGIYVNSEFCLITE